MQSSTLSYSCSSKAPAETQLAFFVPRCARASSACVCVHWLSPLSQLSHPETKSCLFTTSCFAVWKQKVPHHWEKPNLWHRGCAWLDKPTQPVPSLSLPPAFPHSCQQLDFQKDLPKSLNTHSEGWRGLKPHRFQEIQVHLLLQFQSSSQEAADPFPRSFCFHSCHLRYVSYFGTAH